MTIVKCKSESCSVEFEPKSSKHQFCSDRCRYRTKEAGTADLIEKNKQRCAKWYRDENNRTLALARGAARKLSSKTGRGEWEEPAPNLGFIPGAFAPIALENGHQFEHRQLAALHGMMTSITGAHRPNNPVFTLLRSHLGCGWGAYISDLEMARKVAARFHDVRFNDQVISLVIGCLFRVKSPIVKSGAWNMRISTVTPVHCRSNGGETQYSEPTSSNIKGTLEGFTARRLGIETHPEDVQVIMLKADTTPAKVSVAGNGRKLGDMVGWHGNVIVKTNALGRLLIECAALGLGLGGKTAFGFGRIKSEVICSPPS